MVVSLRLAMIGVLLSGCWNTEILVCPEPPGEACECSDGRPGSQVCNPEAGAYCDCGGARDFNNPNADAGTSIEQTPRFASIEGKDACASDTTQAKPGEKIDIIFVVDNSGSMDMEIAAVRSNINVNFANVIASSGVDFRVVMISQFGDGGQSVCVEPPLAGAPCGYGLARTASTRFFHYDLNVQSYDPWCLLLETFDQPDHAMLAPEGWNQWLRPEAHKLFVLITDDSARCSWQGPDGIIEFGQSDPVTDATTFHQALLARSPEQFGVPPEIRYTWYSIVGMPANDPLTAPWFPHDPIIQELCATAANAGAGYQALSIITDALRYPVCEGLGFEGVFRALSRGVIRTAKADCTFDLPEPEDQTIDNSRIAVEYRTGGAGEPTRFDRVVGRDACDGDGFFLEHDRIRLCPRSCATVTADDNAKVEVWFGCGADGPS